MHQVEASQRRGAVRARGAAVYVPLPPAEDLCTEGERLLSGPVTRAALSRWEERTMSPHKLAPDPALRTRLLGLRSRARRLLRSDGADPLVPESVDWSAPAQLRARVQALCEEGEALLARGASRAELGRWSIHQHGFSSRIRGVDPALATRLRALSLKLRANRVTPEPAVVAPSVTAPTCTHCPTHCPAA